MSAGAAFGVMGGARRQRQTSVQCSVGAGLPAMGGQGQSRSFTQRVRADLAALSKQQATPSRRLHALGERYWVWAVRLRSAPIAGKPALATERG